ncbi:MULTISPECIES: helix-turn-helix transcriptional regulator [Pseudomonas]|nr:MULTISPECIES: LuxR C-terminal-related transcriptional regulator [Pseudomonas]AVE03137.1 helix-turn-helix transcriptional regulator [Pseudomonas palleroniana]NCE88299.1 helix-turn-helix transcriptional regulator [Pseudomonas sp. Q1]UOK36797.1 LuxR C-terminal-related transcriptional regulator [Pseudomonas palleroniana]UOP09639.1 LuxR C-terminal-related transcriptional regulator [Pseudomonas palleroniana]
MNAQTLFPLIGKVIASTGSRHFSRFLHDLVLTKVPVDATHITHVRIDGADGARVEPTGAGAEILSPEHMSSLIKSAQPRTPESPTALQVAKPVLAQSVASFSASAGASSKPALTPIPFSSQLHLKSRKKEYFYIISFYREHIDDFSMQEQIILKDFSLLLLALVEKHINAINSQGMPDKNIAVDGLVPQNRDMDSLRQRFEARLVQSGLRLSNREKEICAGLLAGRTAPELAEALELKVNTVESYLKRAVIKMGISGRHSLIRWMHANPGNPTVTRLQ